MVWFSSRNSLSVGVLVGVVSGCAPAGGTGGAGTAAVPVPDTAAVAAADSAAVREDSFPARGTVTSEEIRRAPRESIEELLEGRVSGVSVFRTADGIAVRIRGFTSNLASNEPLYVLDGIPIHVGPGGVLNGLSPYDIESIKVLKDPVDTAMYGIRGANGVIVITTKRPGS